MTGWAVGMVLVALSAGCGADRSACKDLRALNTSVRQAPLAADAVTCLQSRLQDAADLDRRRVSQLLLAHARQGDVGPWAEQAKAHVALYPGELSVWVQLANQEQRQGPAGGEQSLAYAREGLAWLQRHPATTDADKRSYHDLLKARAVAAEMLAPPGSPQEKKDRTAQFSRDWFTVASSLQLPTERAQAMCINTGASNAFCTGQSSAE
ncbi:MAG: hypothetical protein AB8H79_00740 [Myxococcota bacterium]